MNISELENNLDYFFSIRELTKMSPEEIKTLREIFEDKLSEIVWVQKNRTRREVFKNL